MKKMIVLVSMVVFSLSFFAGCDSKGKKCGKLYDKMNSCVKEMMGDKAGGDSPLGKKDDFVKECKKDKDLDKAAKCLDKKDCKDFMACLEGIKGDGKAEDMKPEDMKPEEMKAEEPKPEEMKAEEPKPEEPKAEEMKAEEAPADMQ